MICRVFKFEPSKKKHATSLRNDGWPMSRLDRLRVILAGFFGIIISHYGYVSPLNNHSNGKIEDLKTARVGEDTNMSV